METACIGDGLLGRSGREMKLPVERIYSTNWWNRTDGYSTVHFAVLASFWRVASDERAPLVISPKPLDIYLIPDVNACMYIGCICSTTLYFRRWVWIVDEKFSLVDGNHLDEAFHDIQPPDGIERGSRDRIFFFFLTKYKENYSF